LIVFLRRGKKTAKRAERFGALPGTEASRNIQRSFQYMKVQLRNDFASEGRSGFCGRKVRDAEVCIRDKISDVAEGWITAKHRQSKNFIQYLHRSKGSSLSSL
jgi:hypothetical protein